MKKQALTTIEIEMFAPSSSAALDEMRQPVFEDSEAKPEARRRSALGWFIDSLALASCSMAGVYVGVWLDPPNDEARPTPLSTVDREKQHHDESVLQQLPRSTALGSPEGAELSRASKAPFNAQKGVSR